MARSEVVLKMYAALGGIVEAAKREAVKPGDLDEIEEVAEAIQEMAEAYRRMGGRDAQPA